MLSSCQDRSSHKFDNYNLNEKSNIKIKLPKELSEISGLAYSEDNHIVTNNDETGTVFEIDILTGKILNEFYLGKKKIKKDFEGIAAVNDSLFMVTSSGVLYQFSFPDEEQNVEYKKYKTFLSSKYDVEGLCFDRATNSLLLACKGFAGKDLKGYKAIFKFDLSNHKLAEEPRFLIWLKKLKDKYDIKNFSPSGIEIHPRSGNFFIVSANIKAIIEISPDGKILEAVKLDKKYHKQPEGITILPDGSLIIADEGNGGKGFITIIKEN